MSKEIEKMADQETKPATEKKPVEKKKYRITEAAGPFVNGRPSPGAGAELELTEEEALYLELNGEIEAVTERRTSPKTEKASD